MGCGFLGHGNGADIRKSASEVIRMNIAIKAAEEKHVVACVNILQNTELGTVYFSNDEKTVALLRPL